MPTVEKKANMDHFHSKLNFLTKSDTSRDTFILSVGMAVEVGMLVTIIIIVL